LEAREGRGQRKAKTHGRRRVKFLRVSNGETVDYKKKNMKLGEKKPGRSKDLAPGPEKQEPEKVKNSREGGMEE